MDSTFQLSLELTKAFPVGQIVHSIGSKIWQLALDLRKSDSDIVVEVELASLFGRGKIQPELAVAFTSVVRLGDVVPLYKKSDIALDSTPGATLRNALENPYFFSTIVQLSFFGWIYNRDEFATLMSKCMRKRVETKVPGASIDPGVAGISTTMAACSSQTGSFQWSSYINDVEARLRAVIPNYLHSTDYMKLPETLLQAALDYLFLAQSLPEDRRMTVSNEAGCITLIVWAHYVLGLTVLVRGNLNTSVIFRSEASSPQVVIFWLGEHKSEQPEVRLLDHDLAILLEIQPEGKLSMPLKTEERHTLRSYGTTYLRRLFNKTVFTADNHPVYEETAKLVTALAIHTSGRVDRDMSSQGRIAIRHMKDEAENLKPYHPIELELWRLLKCARVIFHGLALASNEISEYVKYLSQTPLDADTLPFSWQSLLDAVTSPSSTPSSGRSWAWLELNQHMFQLAEIVFLFACVEDIAACEDMPLLVSDNRHARSAMVCKQISEVSCNLETRVLLCAHDIFHGIAKSLTKSTFEERDDDPVSGAFRPKGFLWLISDFGWSIFLSTVGQKDPLSTRPELVRVQRGMPVSQRTGERRFLCRDFQSAINYRPGHKLENESDYQPRAFATTSSATEYWNVTTRAFECQLILNVEPSAEWSRVQGTMPSEEVISYRQMQFTLWRTYSTPRCFHTFDASIASFESARAVPLKLGPDAVAILGWTNAVPACAQRIVIFSTKGEPGVRWITLSALNRFVPLPDHEPSQPKTMLRTLDCCDQCALKHTASQPGKWYLIL